jgi:serine/threonine protein kinase/WD40 repeat protein
MAGEVGESIGNYRLLRVIGEGGFATVYLGEHRHLGTQAAIKVVDTQLEDEDVESFLAESRLVARLTHPNILRVMEYGVEGGVPYLVMEYAPNGTLRTRHPAGVPVPVAAVLPYVQQVAEALHYAHEQKIVHRDIKPENLLLGRQGQVLLADFGIAVVAQSSRSSSGEEVAGTIAYMAPEQLQGRPRPASDQYALAVVVYELLTGARPFSGGYAELAAQHVMAAPPSLRARVPGIPPAVEEVVRIALAKDPKERFATVRAFAKGLENALTQGERLTRPLPAVTTPLPAQARPTTPINTPSGPVQPTSPGDEPTVTPAPSAITPVSQTITPALSLTPSGPTATPTPSSAESGPLRQSEVLPTEVIPLPAEQPGAAPRPEARPRRVVLRRAVLVGLGGLAIAGGVVTWEVLSGRLKLGDLPFGASAGAAASPTPAATATQTPAPVPTATPIPLGTTLYTYTGHVGTVTTLCWSPDGGRIASAGTDFTVHLWDALTGGNKLTYNNHFYPVNTVAWSPNGLYMASGDSHGGVQVWGAVLTNMLVNTGLGAGYQIYTVSWSTDSTRLAYSGEYPEVRILQAPSFNEVANLPAVAAVHATAWSPDGAKLAAGITSFYPNQNTVEVWDAATQQHLFNTAARSGGLSGGIAALAWAPDSSKFASASFAAVDVWDAATGKNLGTYHGHSNYVLGLGWSPDGKTLASGGADGTVQLWDAATLTRLYTYKGSFKQVNALAWSPKGKLIASAGDETVEVWVAAV